MLAVKQYVHCCNCKGVSNKFYDVYKQLLASLNIQLVRKVLLPGSLLFPFEKIAIPYTKKHLLMQLYNLPTSCVCGKSLYYWTFFNVMMLQLTYLLSISNLFKHTNWATAPIIFGWNFVTSYIQCRWSCHIGYTYLPKDLQVFVDVRVFNPLAKSHYNQSLSSCYRKNQNEKKRARMMNASGTLNMVHFSVAGGTDVWDQLPQSFTNDWLQCYQINYIWLSHTIHCMASPGCSLSFYLGGPS